MAENLKKTILVDNEEYNINAVYSDEAGKVTESLTLVKSLLAGEDSTDAFNGSETKEISYVPASGGKFTGSVYLGVQNPAPADNELITSSQINNRVAELKGAPLCTFNPATYQVTPAVLAPSDQMSALKTVVGTAADFKKLNDLFIATDAALPRGIRFSSVQAESTCKVHSFLSDEAEELDVILPYRAVIRNTQTGTTSVKTVTGMVDNAFGPPESYSIEGAPIMSVIIPDCIATVSKTAFKYCKQLTKVTMFNGVTTISDEAFYGCTALKTIILPASVTSIGKNAFYNCTNLEIYYGGSETQWSNITINSIGNQAFKNATVHYNQSMANIDLNSAFIYICKDADAVASPVSNKMYLKLPGNETVEISKGADRLNSTVVASENYYTYEGLAEIIARINARLDSLGVGVTTTALASAPLLSLAEVNTLVPDIDVESVDQFDPETVPTIQDLVDVICAIQGKGKLTVDTVAAAIATGIGGDTLYDLRQDLNELATEVEIELNREDNNANIYSSVLSLQDQIKDKTADPAKGHGYHVPTPAASANNTIFLRNDNSWCEVSPANLKMTDYSKASSAAAIAATDSLNTAIGKLEKALEGKQSGGSYASSEHSHGNIDKDGKLTTSNAVVITGDDGKISASTITTTELGYLANVTSDIQGQLNGKQDTHTHPYLADSTTYAGSSAQGGAASSVANKLTIQLNGGNNTEGDAPNKFEFDGSASKSIDITPSSIGLGNVENTADSAKEVLSATKLAIDAAVGDETTPVYFTADGVPAVCTSLSLNTTGNAASATTATMAAALYNTTNTEESYTYSDINTEFASLKNGTTSLSQIKIGNTTLSEGQLIGLITIYNSLNDDTDSTKLTTRLAKLVAFIDSINITE